jgi:hypothetical protein
MTDNADGIEIDPDAELEIKIDDAGIGDVDAGANAADEGAQSLQEQLDAANKRAESAERLAEQREADRVRAAEESNRTKADLTVSHSQVIANALTAAEGERRELRSAIRQAKEAGDYDAEVEALDKLGQLNVKVQRLNEGKAELDSRAEQERDAAKRPADPVENYIQQANLSPRAANWIREHSDVVTDRNMTTKLTAAHWGALADGITEGSDAYFEAIEQRMGFGDQQAARQVEAQQPARRQAPAAPPSRDGGTGGSARPGTIRLSAAQREAARMAGISDAEYAQNLVALQREGTLTH